MLSLLEKLRGGQVGNTDLKISNNEKVSKNDRKERRKKTYRPRPYRSHSHTLYVSGGRSFSRRF